MKVGFIRVSTEDQNTIRQEILMKRLGVERVERVYIDVNNAVKEQREYLYNKLYGE